jgi:uncharacterized membrane protein YcaP (DUF421 family)
MTIPDFSSDLPGIVIRSAIIYGFLVIALRIGGKREVGQLSTPDLVVLLIVANGAQNAMVGDNTTLIGGIVACVTVLVLARLVQIATSRSVTVSKALIGEPRILIREGRALTKAMHEEEISDDELMAAIREHGIEKLEEVRLAVLEVDGSISILPTDPQQSTSGGPSQRVAGHLARRSRGVGRRARNGGGKR